MMVRDQFKEDLAFSKLDTFWPDYESKLIGTKPYLLLIYLE